MEACLGLLAAFAVVVWMTCETAPPQPVVSRQERLARFAIPLASGHGYNMNNLIVTPGLPTSILAMANGSTLTTHTTTSPMVDPYAHTSKGGDG
jgi:hypothetical protein